MTYIMGILVFLFAFAIAAILNEIQVYRRGGDYWEWAKKLSIMLDPTTANVKKFVNPRERNRAMEEELDYFKNMVVSYSDIDYPNIIVRQGHPIHEVEDAVDAEFVRNLINKIQELDKKVKEYEQT